MLLPDQWHLVMELPPGDDRDSLRKKQIKSEFNEQWLEAGLPEADVIQSQRKRGERGIWQPRLWEHMVRDEDVFDRLVPVPARVSPARDLDDRAAVVDV